MEVFSSEDIRVARSSRKKLLWVWFAVLAVWLAAIGTMIGVNIYQVVVNADRSLHIPFTVLSILLTAVFGGFTLFHFSIKFKLTHKYCRMLRDIERGLKDTMTGTFLRFDDTIQTKDGVYFYDMELDCKPLRRDDITLRKVLIEHTIPHPDFCEGDKIKFTTHANILVSYEVLSVKPRELKEAEPPNDEQKEEAG